MSMHTKEYADTVYDRNRTCKYVQMMHHIENVVFFRRMKVERSYAGPGDVRVQSFVFGNRMAAWYHRNTFSLSYLESFIHDIFHHEAPKNTTKKAGKSYQNGSSALPNTWATRARLKQSRISEFWSFQYGASFAILLLS